MKRRGGYSVYESDVGRLLKKNVKSIRKETRAMWSKVDRAEKDRWAVVSEVRNVLINEDPDRAAFFRGQVAPFVGHAARLSPAEIE